jgi:hypothetical protein
LFSADFLLGGQAFICRVSHDVLCVLFKMECKGTTLVLDSDSLALCHPPPDRRGDLPSASALASPFPVRSTFHWLSGSTKGRQQVHRRVLPFDRLPFDRPPLKLAMPHRDTVRECYCKLRDIVMSHVVSHNPFLYYSIFGKEGMTRREGARRTVVSVCKSVEMDGLRRWLGGRDGFGVVSKA